jgi:DNA-binding FadR family transcriptional regulator
MARIIWSNPGNPTAAVSRRLGITRWQLREALHEIKRKKRLRPGDRVTIYDDGTVTDATGEHLGNIHDEI